MKKILAAAFVACLGAAVASPVVQDMPPPPEDAALDRAIGTWEGDCEGMGMTWHERDTYAWVLGHQFVRCEGAIQFGGPDAAGMNFEYHIYYKPLGGGRYEVAFYSSDGQAIPSTGTSDENSLTVEWEEATEGPGRVRHEMISDTEMRVSFYHPDEMGEMTEFGGGTLRRQ